MYITCLDMPSSQDFYVNNAYLINNLSSCTYVSASQDLLSSHISEERFVYLVQKESFLLNSRKIFPTKEMHSIAPILLHVKTGHRGQSVSDFEVKDLAANGMCRQVNLLA